MKSVMKLPTTSILSIAAIVMTVLLTATCWAQTAAKPAPAATGRDLEIWLEHAQAATPRQAAAYAANPLVKLKPAAEAVEQWGAVLSRFEPAAPPDAILATIERLLSAKEQADRQLEQVLTLRTGFTGIEDRDQRRTIVRNYLATCSRWIDLSGRLRAIQSETINSAAFRFAGHPADRERLIDLLLARRSSIGADIMSLALFDPPANTPNRAQPATPEVKEKLLRLIAVTGQLEMVPRLADFARSLQTTPPLVVSAAETIRQVGLPQDERPGQAADVPKPPITARQLHELLTKIPRTQLSDEQNSRRDELVEWLKGRMAKGVVEDSYRLGRFEVQPGDWLLMRNPSPYNLFTELSPGLFTHVGVVTLETGADGIRHMVLVDLPERGTQMPATNIDAFVQRTLHYVFLRHKDPVIGAKMGEVAASVIGNPTEFDLNFRTGRVNDLKGQPLAGKKIHTYCAGLLWLCAQETGLPRTDFFPLPESVAPGKTAENLAKLGMAIGHDFVSPTGALFSADLSIVGRREPMYDARREVEEAVFDHFAYGLEHKTLTVSPDLYQSLRLKLAEASKNNPLLAQALAKAAGVSTELDLAAAARGAAVVETLDDVAYTHSGDYQSAYAIVTYPGSLADLEKEVTTPAEVERVRQIRRRHADILTRLQRERMTPRQLRELLVKYYSDRGQAQIDQRFFTAGKR